MDSINSINRIAARVHAALADADILAVGYGDGVICCGDTAADHTSTEVAYGEIMVIVNDLDDLDEGTGFEVSVGVVWRDEEGGVVDGDDTGFDPDDLDGIVAEVRRLRGGAA